MANNMAEHPQRSLLSHLIHFRLLKALLLFIGLFAIRKSRFIFDFFYEATQKSCNQPKNFTSFLLRGNLKKFLCELCVKEISGHLKCNF